MPLRMVRVDQESVGRRIQMKWSSVFSGAFTTLGFGLLFMLLGNAVGLSIHNVLAPSVSGTLRFWSWIYMAATAIFSFYLGGLLSTRSNEIESFAGGALHGVVSWGLTSTIASIVAGSVSPAARLVLGGTGTNPENWLAVCIVGFGLGASVVGGTRGKRAIRYVQVEELKKEEVKEVG